MSVSDEERVARSAHAWHRGSKMAGGTKMPMLNRELMMSWNAVERQRYFQSGGLYFPSSKPTGRPDVVRPHQKTMDLEGCAEELCAYLGIEEGDRLRVALVGNGGLSEMCRKQLLLGKFDHVVRFNDPKNYRMGDAPSTLHVVRTRWDAMDAPYTGLALYKRHVPLLLVGSGMTLEKPLNDLPGIHKCPDGDWYEVAAHLNIGGLKLFPGDKATEFTNMHDQGPSTGLWAISVFQIIEGVREIHTFGMNWAFDDSPDGRRYNHSSEEGYLVKESGLYTKVKVHPPPSDEYDPPTIDNEATARQKSVDNSGIPYWSPFMRSNPAVFKAQIAQTNRHKLNVPPIF
jgi:hypothetical protein